MSEFTGKVAIVTGSNSGIGEAVALMLASRGASVTLCGRNKERLDAAMTKCLDANGHQQDRILALQGDVTDGQYREHLVKETVEKFGHLDILVANAGETLPGQEVDQATEATFDKIMNVNLKSNFFLIQKALPFLEKSKGCVVSVSSLASIVPVSSLAIYSMAKAALDHMTKCLAQPLGQKGIRINTVNPGYVSTRVFRFYGDQIDEMMNTLSEREGPKYALKAPDVTVEQVGEAVLFLASDKSSSITGKSLPVDNGRGLYSGFDLSSN